MPAAIEALGCALLQSLLLLQSFAVISIFYHTSCRYYMTASFSGRPSAMPAVFHIAFSACLFSNYFSFAAIPAAPRSFLLPFSLACTLSAPFTALFSRRICLLCRPFRFIPHPPRISLKTALPIHPDSKPKQKKDRLCGP